ncbi:hypothetical protein [Microseira wollei]|uniref:Uncharacterized protein n=1 Tax=Microseira wollei NIES-4236 TaxID=2530354 RepID=A0AAV3XCV3_9CYAN|nr:hypothetical protein [Microseira wollei]GET39211.1 hypothetical protein MiSe_39750 [Microseira wollei NIES-4236]
MNNIELHIEELVLHGMGGSDRYLIGEALQQELTRLLSEKGLPPSLAQGGEIARINAGEFEMKSGAKPEAIGIQIAHKIYGGLRE